MASKELNYKYARSSRNSWRSRQHGNGSHYICRLRGCKQILKKSAPYVLLPFSVHVHGRVVSLSRFLNHHIWNAITQMTMASYLADPDKQQRIRGEAAERISGALRRVANSADLNELSLEVGLTGVELTREADKRAA